MVGAMVVDKTAACEDRMPAKKSAFVERGYVHQLTRREVFDGTVRGKQNIAEGGEGATDVGAIDFVWSCLLPWVWIGFTKPRN